MFLVTKFIREKSVFLSRFYSVRVRFAPSPTGHIHLGSLRTALYNYLFCKSHRGKYILRIEDTDQTRVIDGATEHLIDMLKWTGIEFDEGPHIIGSQHGPYIQSQRLHIYQEYSNHLLKTNQAYKCFCSSERLDLLRRQAASRGEVPKYDNRCRHLSQKEMDKKLETNLPYVIRFKLEHYLECWQDAVYGPIHYDVAANEGDVVILKSDGYPTYHFANVVDDHLMNITHVLRGVEWQVSTVKHLLLHKAFNWTPPTYAHLPLLQNKDGKKFSKRQNDTHVEHYKNMGYYPEAVLNILTNSGSGFKVQDTSGMSLPQLIDNFDLSKLHTNSTRVDFDRLADFNRLAIQRRLKCDKSKSELIERLRRILEEKYFQNGSSTTSSSSSLSSSSVLSSTHKTEDFNDDNYLANVLYNTQVIIIIIIIIINIFFNYYQNYNYCYYYYYHVIG
ncbi:hypothetical protein HELRODRAFT_113813 [Helobdella robusta]|uniref:Nondiscriminating glutamyl-tRNA synthetase EARS2, mitochondrial n=1 Tax=Helobdella robusta TaxID=6412 RepID=T1EFX1_HELRO|nr:hypothetical protein HELRODRAFT_113813 [Helobdella robusta]ESN98496.1 hypothetical protein HELRODRAFT_113813 [Helobdella robusta]